MTFLVLWASVVLIAAALVLSVLLYHSQRDKRALLLTGFLLVIASWYVLLTLGRTWEVRVFNVGPWVHLVTAVFGLAAVLGLDRVLQDERRRRRAISKVQRALEEVSFGLSDATGQEFCRRAVHRVNDILETDYAFISELAEGGEGYAEIVAFAGEVGDEPLTGYDLAGTPCSTVVDREPKVYERDIQQLFPTDELLVDMAAESYIGVPLFAANEDRPLGLIAVVSRRAIEDPGAMLPALQIIATRAQAELQRARQDKALQASERRLRELFEESQEALYISTHEGRMIDANLATVELFGYESREHLLREFDANKHYRDPGDREVIVAHLERDGSFQELDLSLVRCDGKVIDVLVTAVAKRDANGRILAIRGTIRDVTEQRRNQRQSLQSQRLEAVGRMAGGVAHDFNNMLSVIQGQNDLLRESLEPGSPHAFATAEIGDAVDRAAAFTRRLLLLSNSKVLTPQILDLNALISDLVTLLESAVGADIELNLGLGRSVDRVVADSAELEQVLLNLVINARDAMPEGGRIMITTRNRVLETRDGAAPPERWVELAVEDDGAGIASEHVDYIFDPFYTTKGLGLSSGLGLATVFQIVEQLQGKLEVESAPGEGSRFVVRLPSSTTQEVGEPLVVEDDGAKGGSERVLVVDDEPAVRLMLQRVLERQGYEVAIAASGAEALERIRGAQRFDLLISDVMMPGMTGPVLAAKAKSHDDSLRVLLISGFVGGGGEGDDFNGDFPLLRKPFSTRDLGLRIREVLTVDAVAGG